MRLHSRAEQREFAEVRAVDFVRDPTPAEEAAWTWLSGLGFKPQQVIEGETKNGGYWVIITDFLNEKLKLIVEIDGDSHRKKKGKDRRRDTRVATLGFTTLRLTNKEILRAPESAKAKVLKAMEQLKGETR